MFDDWEERYSYLIDLGKQLPQLPPEDYTDANKVTGCMSQVWMIAHVDSSSGKPRLKILADSDAHIVKGLIAVLLVVFSGKTPAEIKDIDIQAIFERLELASHLSMNRRNGFYAMVERIRQFGNEAA
jgi:cysteine desulfuration protein SufE